MLDLTLSLLPKPWHLKASTEGAYRFLFDSYALLCFGVNVKNWSLRKDISMFSSRSSFAPLAFAYLASKENDEADTHLGRALIATARTSQHDFNAESILQWRGDMRLGIEAARKSLAPSAKRLSNWANVTGSTSQGWAFVKRASAAEETQDASTAAPILSDFQTIVGLRLRCCMGLAWDNQLFGFFYFLLSFLLGKAVLKNLLLGIIAAEFRIARDRMKQDFRLRMAIARARLKKADTNRGVG
eukprot:symbB.v1.2.042018.t1/scaffold9045.1/size4344/1